MNQRPLVLSLPGTAAIPCRRNLLYKSTDTGELHLDVYEPDGRIDATPRPAVIFVHGDGPDEMLRTIKDAALFEGWGRLAAVSGLVGVTFNHRSTGGMQRMQQPMDDIADLLRYVRSNAAVLNIDAGRLCLFAFSFGVPFGITAALREGAGAFRCLVAYYGPLDLMPLRPQLGAEISDAVLRERSPISYLDAPAARTPLFAVRAAHDFDWLNEGIDAFVAAARVRNLPVTLRAHATGQHAFDVLDDNDESRAIMRETLAFIAQHT